MIENRNITTMTVTYDTTTTNKSFMDMHYYLANRGVQNNKFFLALFDRDLVGINPRDPNLNYAMKQKVMRECMANFWYFIREVVLIPDSGGAVGSGIRYKLHRGNLALNFGFVHNWNMFLELPRQFGKTTAALSFYLWVYNFGSRNTEMMFINKKHQSAKDNLDALKKIRDALPSYLQLKEQLPDPTTGKAIKTVDRIETIQNPFNRNKIRTLPGATSVVGARATGRGLTMPIHYYDEYAFMKFNKEIRMAATPAFSTASRNAKNNNSPYGILITTTPGDLTTDEGASSYETRNNASEFDERFYDKTEAELVDYISANTKSSFVHMIFTYKQLGADPEYFKRQVVDLENNWTVIRREVLLEWAKAATNCPFTNQDLQDIEKYVKQPDKTIIIGGNYVFQIFGELDPRFPPIIGVDVAGGYSKDSSAITIIDPITTKVTATMNCNYISPIKLAEVIYELVTQHMPNAVVNIERNGGFGASVLASLVHTSIKRNLYYEVKDRIIEERSDGIHTYKQKQKVKVYGFDNTGNSRDALMTILRGRVELHKDKFISPIIYSELQTLEVKRNGRIEHSDAAHDDQLFSLLMALYVWYEGKDLMQNFGITKGTIKTDQDTVETISGLQENLTQLNLEVELDDQLQETLNTLNPGNVKLYEQWLQEQAAKDKECLENALQTPLGRKAYAYTYNVSEASLMRAGVTRLPDSVFAGMTSDIDNNIYMDKPSELQSEFDTLNIY